jgi:hypothetical protein
VNRTLLVHPQRGAPINSNLADYLAAVNVMADSGAT